MTFDRRLLRESAPFAATGLLGFALVPIGNRIDWVEYSLAVALAVAIVCAGPFVPWRKLPRTVSVFPPLLALLAIALLRDASGGTSSGAGALALLPVFWLALHGSRAQLLVVIAALFPMFLGPVLLDGSSYPSGSWRIAIVFAAASALVGIAVQNLVDRVRSHAEALAVREHDLEAMADLSRSLSTSADARERICAMACALSGAHFAVLLEGQPGGALIWTAGAGLDAAFAAEDRPATVLVEPVLRSDTTIGALVVGWHEPATDPRRTAGLVRLLASEAAFVIERADLLGRLTELALTDALTGLPNRRCWDDHVELAIQDAEPFSVAILDLDDFKSFNDGHGHQAGDQLLKESAAAWSGQLRPADMLARLGGDEFVVLLRGLDRQTARPIVDRLRAATPRAQICSAGLAQRENGDAAATLLGRADRELYEVKAAGRRQKALAISQPSDARAIPPTIEVTR
jgi:diguanylate cyclase (GGDEF)-like protein